MVSVVLKSGYQKTLVEVADNVSSGLNSCTDFRDPASVVLSVKDELVEEDSPWHLRYLVFKNDCGPSALQWIQELHRTHGLSVCYRYPI